MKKIVINCLLLILFLLPLLAMQVANNQTQNANIVSKSGEQLYRENCLSCHQLNGGGVFPIAPPLRKTSYVLGDKARLIGIVINGFNEDVEIEGEYYSNPMPAFPQLTDDEIAKVLTYVRSNFGNNAEPVTAKEVSLERAKMKEKNK